MAWKNTHAKSQAKKLKLPCPIIKTYAIFPLSQCAALMHSGTQLLSALNKPQYVFDYITYSFLGVELLYSPSVFQDLCAIIWYWQLTGILKKSVPNNLLKRFIKTTSSYIFRQKCDCVMLYCIETVREVNLAERHNHRIWQAMPVST